MKIQLNGFDIEIDTSDTEMMVKVIDANGQELSNNTYSQSLDTSDDVEDVEIPGVDEIGVDEIGEDESLEDETLEDETLEDESLEDEEEITDTDIEGEDDDITFDENKVYDFNEFKNLSEANKAKLKRKASSTK